MFAQRSCTAALVVSGIILTAPAWAQTADHDRVETIQPPSEWKRPPGDGPDLARVPDLITRQTNSFRREEGRKEVRVNEKLTETARDFAGYMARTDRYGHTADGNQPADRAKEHGYKYCVILENIAYYYNSGAITTKDLVRNFFQGWKDSPGHRRNMLDPDVTETGVAVAQSKKTGYYYAVQMFGRPLSDRIEFRITNAADVPVRYTIGEQTFTIEPGYTRTHQQCRPAEMALRFADDEKRSGQKTIHPEDGGQYVIKKSDGGELQVESR